MLNILEFYKKTKRKIKIFNKSFEVLQMISFCYMFLSFIFFLFTSIERDLIIHGLLNMIFSFLSFFYLCLLENKAYNRLFKLLINNKDKIIREESIKYFKNSDPDYLLLREILINKNISKEELNTIIINLNNFDEDKKDSLLLNILYFYKDIISIEKLLVSNQSSLNDIEKILIEFNIKKLILNHEFIAEEIKIDYLIENLHTLNKEIIEKIILPRLVKNYSLKELTELIFSKNNKNINDNLKINLWNHLNGKVTESVFYLRISIIEEILKNKDESLLMNYKEEFFEQTKEIQLVDMNLLYLMKQKLKDIVPINSENKINKINKVIQI